MCPTAPSRSFGDWNQPHSTRPKKRHSKQSETELSRPKHFFKRLIYRDRVVLRCWVFSNTLCWGSLQLASCEPMGDDMKRDFAVGGDNAAAQAWRWFSVLRSFHHDGTLPSARRKRQLGSLLWSFGWSYADALAEAGSGKTCAVDVQAADACHVVSASFVWGGPKNRDGDFMDGAVVVVLNADGRHFWRTTWSSATTTNGPASWWGSQHKASPMTRLPSFLTCVRRCGGLSMHLWARSPG